MYSEKAPLEDAIDLQHHLSQLAINRQVSPLKGLMKYWGRPGMLSLAGGMPNPEYFPFDTVKADGLVFDRFSTSSATTQSQGTLSWFWNLFSKETTTPIYIPKYPENPDDINLATALQYGLAGGLPQLAKICMEFSTKVYRPAYANFTTMLHAGNTDGWAKTVTTLCNAGEGVLCSEWTYPSALATMKPYGIMPVPVGMDGQGMSSVALRELLSSWDENARGMPQPHVMYVVPVGQNPTGATMLLQRKKEIYDLCVEYDIIIVEDDPYYFLQEGEYVPPSQRYAAKVAETDDEKWIAGLAPSFLRVDYQGRVIRLDTFSKTVAPGCRLGWLTCNPMFAERITRAAETSTQAPCGFGQTLVTSLLLQWQFAGYLRWLKGLGAQYTRRRDFFIDLLVEKFDITTAPASEGIFQGSKVYLAFLKNDRYKEKTVRKPIFSFVPPTSGMFVWLKVIFDDHPELQTVGQETLERRFWIALAEGGLLIGSGEMFAADSTVGSASNSGHFRVSFSNAQDEEMKKAVDIIAKVMKKFHANI